MSPKSSSQTLPPPPVRFYKVVALTFLVITLLLLGVIVFMSSKRATITITTKATPVDLQADIHIGSTPGADVPGMVTSTIVAHSQVFSPSGERTEPGIARGVLTVYNDSNREQPLVATTRFLSEDDILFRLEEGVVVPANSSIDVEVYADQEGATGDIGPSSFTIPGLNELRQQEVYAKSNSDMSGGIQTIGILSQDDIDKAEKILRQSLIDKAQALLPKTSENQTVLVDVSKSSVRTTGVLGEETSSFTASATGTVVAVAYDSQVLEEWTKNQLSRRAIDENEVVEPRDSDPSVSFSSYDSQEKIATVSIFYDGLVSLNTDSPKLAKDRLFGMSKNEIRRYLLSLDHVHSVDVEFRPAWMQTVPRIPEHVSIVVNKVQ